MNIKSESSCKIGVRGRNSYEKRNCTKCRFVNFLKTLGFDDALKGRSLAHSCALRRFSFLKQLDVNVANRAATRNFFAAEFLTRFQPLGVATLPDDERDHTCANHSANH